MTQHDCLIALGSNLSSDAGSPAQTLAAALHQMIRQGHVIRKLSRFFLTPCFPEGAGPDYVNACVHLATSLTPDALLSDLHGIEAAFGRARQARWGSRTLDIDLLACGGEILPDRPTFDIWKAMPLGEQARRMPDRLILPHPRLQDRAFVLVPLHDIAADWRHPVTGHTVSQMRDALAQSDLEAVVPM